MEVSYFHGGTIPLRGCGPRLGGLVVVMAPSSVKPLLCPQADGFSQRTETSNLWSQRLQGREAQIDLSLVTYSPSYLAIASHS